MKLLEQENKVLRRVAAYLRHANLPPKLMFPLVTDLAADGIPVTVSCRVLDLCRQQHYRWRDQPMTDAELDEAYMAKAIFDAHLDDPEFGYRFLADEFRAAGWDVGDRTVWRSSQFRSRKVHRALARHRMVGSMGKVGTAAAIESFFSLLQRTC